MAERSKACNTETLGHMTAFLELLLAFSSCDCVYFELSELSSNRRAAYRWGRRVLHEPRSVAFGEKSACMH